MKIKVTYLGHIRRTVSNQVEEEVELEAEASVADLLTTLSKTHGDPFRKAIYEPRGVDVKPNYIITVNGYLLNQLAGIETKLKEGDQVTLLPIVSGG